MILNLNYDQCSRLSMACLTLAHIFQRDANNPQLPDDLRAGKQRSADMWMRLHDELRQQIDEQQNRPE